MARICVVGAGIVGLSTAVNIQKLIPGAEITLIAHKFGKETTSSGAGGLFRPNLSHIHGVPLETLKRWSKCSWEHYSNLALSSDASASGNNVSNGFIFFDKLEPQFLQEVVFSFHEMTPDELRRMKCKSKYGYNVTTVITECNKYLSWLMRIYRENGGRVVHKKLDSLEELCGQYDVVANCCGLDAITLVNDKLIHPIRGQLCLMNAPWMREFYYMEHDGYSTYVVPHSDKVLIGGCREKGNFSEDIDPAMTESILQRVNQMYPSMKGATMMTQWAGLRPTRVPIRLEKETMDFAHKKLQVVHNYGHGANGISLSWATAVDAAQMVKQCVDKTPAKARL